MRAGLRRLEVVPFEVMLAGLTVISGLAGLLGIGESADPLAKVLPAWQTKGFQAFYLLAGLLILAGLLVGSFRAEAVGLVFLGTGVLVREVVFVYYLGWTGSAVVGGMFYLLVWWACWVRVRALRRGRTLVMTDGIRGEP